MTRQSSVDEQPARRGGGKLPSPTSQSVDWLETYERLSGKSHALGVADMDVARAIAGRRRPARGATEVAA